MKKTILCKALDWHDWTSATLEDIQPTQEQLSTKYGFFDYAKMYCKRCGKVSKYSLDTLKAMPGDKIYLDESDFVALIAGKEIQKGDTKIILKDIGFANMIDLVLDKMNK